MLQVVCDHWHAKIPGILAAAVSRSDADPPHLVHDIRIFANAAACVGFRADSS